MITFENRYVKTLVNIASAIVEQDEVNAERVDWWPSVCDFEVVAKGLGFIKLGSGYFSQAWTHPEIPEYAIKLGFKKEDSGAAYAAFCRQHQGLDGLPEISEIKQIKSGYTVLMKRYKPLEVNSLNRRKVCDMSNVLFGHGTGMEPLVGTLELIKSFFTGIASFDLHGENVMQDEQGNLIITDPVSFKQQPVDTCKRRVMKGHSLDRLIKDIEGEFILPANRDAILREVAGVKLISENDIPVIEYQQLVPNRPEIHKAKKPHFLIARDERNGMKPRMRMRNK